MSPEELKKIIEDVISQNPVIPWWAYVLFAAITLATAYFGSYIAEKGRGTAKKEDIEELTAQIKVIEHSYDLLLEASKSTNQLRIAAVEKRLQAHQEAYKLWRRMFSELHSENIYEIVQAAHEWWNDNCLYLEPEAREAFFQCMVSAKDYEWYVKDCGDPKLARMSGDTVRTTGKRIVAAVELPPLNEAQDFEPKNS